MRCFSKNQTACQDCNRILPVFLIIFILLAGSASAEIIGSVDTKFKFLTPDHSIKVEAFDDPDVEGIACYLSRTKKGGVKGTLGLAEETSHASIDCKQTGPVKLKKKLKNGQRVFRIRRSLIFKKLQVVRFIDPERNNIVYLAYSDRMIDGSPENSISAVSIMPWLHGDLPQLKD